MDDRVVSKLMGETRYELRIQFDSPYAMGQGLNVAIPAIVEAGVPVRMEQPEEVAIEEGQERPLSDDERVVFEAGLEASSPSAGTLEADDDEGEEI